MSNTSKLWLTISLSLLGGIIVGASIFFGWYFFTNQAEPVAPAQQNTTETNRTNTTSSTNAANTVAEQPLTIPAFWKTYSSEGFGAKFKYPSEWGTPEVDVIAGDGDSLYEFPEEALNFDLGLPEGASGFRSVRIARLDAITDSVDASSSVDKEVDTLLDVYSDRAVTSKIVVLPPVNAGTVASTEPTYIESKDGSFRGMYYYSYSTQSMPPGEPAMLPELQIVMTDGEIVVSFYRRSNFTYDSQEGAPVIEPIQIEPEGDKLSAATCTAGLGQDIVPANDPPQECELDSVLVDEFEEIYRLIISSLTNG